VAPKLVLSVVVPELLELDVHNKEKLPREREEMGFRSIDLNKEIHRQNNYNLERYVASMNGILSLELEEMVRHASALFCIVSATCYKFPDLLSFVLRDLMT
jgi:hypothetical protein